ncbi:MAG: type II toxin-antitoxin system HicA family toxin [Jaaginema sp. PMC 1079.18]|nr:type II toxin-antitoxin system HicA family toxin [Jaaginema sp. PMC 1080.18]MEC4853785.1 type II toxin-antitoxin system HicA family toxin [Jaaginema sp. PMC 1079.18]MEC4866397.1 type II toxin-antitoxin system HicA family toxin [Jaaginema sp. PMC 1078.18]
MVSDYDTINLGTSDRSRMQALSISAVQECGSSVGGELNSKQRRTLVAIYTNPVRSDINWTDIETLLVALGAYVHQGQGSRVRVALNGVKAVFHEPHPQKEVCKGAVKSVRKFLAEAGISPD